MSCDTLSDRMSLVASGQAAWSEEESRHLEQCADCASEWHVVQQAARVGSGLPQLDAERLSDTVLHRLATEPVIGRYTRRGWLTAAAIAAAAILLAIFLPGDPGRGENPGEAALAIPMAELDSLSQEQLRSVLESIDEPLETPTVDEAPSMLDLDDQQLERVLRSLEG